MFDDLSLLKSFKSRGTVTETPQPKCTEHPGFSDGLQSCCVCWKSNQRKVGGNVLITLHTERLIGIYLCDDIKT